MDIGELIKFKPKGADDGLPPKVSIYRLYNRPVHVLKWEVKSSRFDDGSGQFAEVTVKILDNGEEVRFNTGSRVIISQLEEVAKAMDAMGQEEDRTFTCVIKSMGNFVKMYPVEQSKEAEE